MGRIRKIKRKASYTANGKASPNCNLLRSRRRDLWGDQAVRLIRKDNPNIDTVYLCMDNDDAGQTANKQIADKLFTRGIKHESLVPPLKDWNEVLLFEKQGEEAICQAFQL